MFWKIYLKTSSGFGESSISAHVFEEVPVWLARKVCIGWPLDTPCLRVDCHCGLITGASVLMRDASFSGGVCVMVIQHSTRVLVGEVMACGVLGAAELIIRDLLLGIEF